MLIRWVDWPQEEIWDKVYPPEMEYLFSIALPRRSSLDGKMMWNYFPTTYKVEIHIYDEETIVAFKLKFSNDTNKSS